MYSIYNQFDISSLIENISCKNFNCLLQGDFGVYTQWVRKKFDSDMSSAAEYEAVIDAADQQGNIVRDTALQVYRASVMSEVEFFAYV